MTTTIKYAFLNGLNMIRCSDNQLQIYQSSDGSGIFLNQDITCANKDAFLDDGYTGLVWDRLTLLCVDSSAGVREEQTIFSRFGYKISEALDHIEGQLGRSNTLYPLNLDTKHSDNEAIISSINSYPVNSYYIENDAARIIYMRFMNQPMICRLTFTKNSKTLCDEEKRREIDDAEYVCYTDIDASGPPSSAQLEAELDEINSVDILDDKDAFLLEKKRPVCLDFCSIELIASESLISQTFSPADWSASTDNIIKPIPAPSGNATILPIRPKNKLIRRNTTKQGEGKSNARRTVGLILGILVLLAVVAGAAFYLVKKQRSNRLGSSASSSSINAERGKAKDISASVLKDNEQSLINDDDNVEIPIDQQASREKPNIASQKSAANRKAQRGGTNMVFNEDG